MKNVNEYMLIFRLNPQSIQLSEEEIESINQGWGPYFGNLAISEKLVSTHRLDFEGQLLSADSSSSEGLYLSNGELVTGNLIVKAETKEEALEIAKGSPILQMGGNVEIRKILPM